MNAWFEPEVAPWLSFLSLLSLLAVLSAPAEAGKYKTAVIGTLMGAVGLGVALLVVAGLARLSEQPWYVVFPFLVTGAALTVACLGGLRDARRAYAQAEERKIAARNL
jgi:hypothetical protein